MFSKIENVLDVDSAIDYCIKSGVFKTENKFELKNLVNKVIYHDKLKNVFEMGNKIYNEKDILVPRKGLIRPDKVVLTKTKCYVLDYKTGKAIDNHSEQILEYSNYLESIISLPIVSYLVYINKDVTVKDIIS